MTNMIKALAVLGLLTGYCIASAQWSFDGSLDPAGSTMSETFAGSGNIEAGYAKVSGLQQAGVWSGSAASWQSFSPAGALASEILGMSGTQMVGNAETANANLLNAALWNGTAGSWINLNPSSTAYSNALATDGVTQVGFANYNALPNAGMWSGSSGSWVNLNPTVASQSEAAGVYGNTQVGWAVLDGTHHQASMWNGSAGSWVNLNPSGSQVSSANAVYGDTEGGEATVAGVAHASLWTGSATSWIDLNPTNSEESAINAMNASYQVGSAYLGQTDATIWAGSASSYFNLASLLPSNQFNATNATSVWTTNGVTYIGGYGELKSTGETVALLWQASAPEPASITCVALGVGILLRRRARLLR